MDGESSKRVIETEVLRHLARQWQLDIEGWREYLSNFTTREFLFRYFWYMLKFLRAHANFLIFIGIRKLFVPGMELFVTQKRVQSLEYNFLE